MSLPLRGGGGVEVPGCWTIKMKLLFKFPPKTISPTFPRDQPPHELIWRRWKEHHKVFYSQREVSFFLLSGIRERLWHRCHRLIWINDSWHRGEELQRHHSSHGKWCNVATIKSGFKHGGHRGEEKSDGWRLKACVRVQSKWWAEVKERREWELMKEKIKVL